MGRPVPERWLHLTIQSINHLLDDATVDAAIRRRLVPKLAEVFLATPAFTVIIGSVLTYYGGAFADVHDDQPLVSMIDRVREVISEVCGPVSVAHDSRPGHMALAYGLGKPGGDAAQRNLRRVRPSHAPMTIETIHLVEVEQDTVERLYRWTRVKKFPLAAPVSRPGINRSLAGSP